MNDKDALSCPPGGVPCYQVLRRGRRVVVVAADWSWSALLWPWAWPLMLRLWGFGGALALGFAAAYGLYLARGDTAATCGLVGVEVIGRLVAARWTHRLWLRRAPGRGWMLLLTVAAISAEDALVSAYLRSRIDDPAPDPDPRGCCQWPPEW